MSELIDAENIMIPFLRAKYDGDKTHDQITWLMQKETRMGQTISTQMANGDIGVSVGQPYEETFLMCMLNIDGIMFHVKSPTPPGLTDRTAALSWAERESKHMLCQLVIQMREFSDKVSDSAVDLSRLIHQ